MNMNVSLTEQLGDFIRQKVDSGNYASSSEVVRAALRLMQKQEELEAEKLAWLRKAWQEGIDSGESQPLDITALIAEARARKATPKA